MIFRQFIHDDLGCASYLVGDEDAGIAAVVDPRLEIDEYLAFARYHGVDIEHVLETHNHADHVSGHGRLSTATGARIHVHRLAEPDYEHEPFDDGWTLELGELRIEALHTPGHRPEHTAFLLTDGSRAAEPWAVLTGDSLFVGDVARPDLAIDREEGASEIFHSLHDRLLTLSPETEVWPAHLGGSMCGGPAMDMKVSSTVGFERRHNELLGESEERTFVTRALAQLGPQPPNFRNIVALNRGRFDGSGIVTPPPLPLAPRQVEERRQAGAMLVDVRTDEQFDQAHIPGSVMITMLRNGFGTKLAWLADPEREIVLIGRDDEDAVQAAKLAAAIGVRHVTGALSGGMTSWRQERRPTNEIGRVDVDELHRLANGPGGVQIVDVREESEWRASHIPGSLFAPYHDLDALPDGLDPQRPVAAICASGQRSGVAASLLAALGAREVLHVVDGGVPAWERAGYPIERP